MAALLKRLEQENITRNFPDHTSMLTRATSSEVARQLLETVLVQLVAYVNGLLDSQLSAKSVNLVAYKVNAQNTQILNVVLLAAAIALLTETALEP